MRNTIKWLAAPLVLAAASIFLVHCSSQDKTPPTDIYLGQGIMVGEVTDRSAILQTRLTASVTLVDGDVPGREGRVQFVLSAQDSLAGEVIRTAWMNADSSGDYIVKVKIDGLQPNQRYYYQATYGPDTTHTQNSPLGNFRANPGPEIAAPVSFVVVTGMNYYHFHYGPYDSTRQYRGADKALGYPALESIRQLNPDYFIGTGDNVYFDHPAVRDFQRAVEDEKRHPLPGLFNGKEVTTESGMRRKYHVQFVQPRYKELFRTVGTYWEKDDHDYRFNDADPYMDFAISHELGIKNFKEQLPVTDPREANAVTYRTIRLSKDAHIWLLEGRDYRSANDAPDGPEKTIWGAEQKAWLQRTLLESDAAYKFIISPTPMVGPDDAYKKDNHTNPEGFRYEGDQFFQWLKDNDFLHKNLYLICGDRHWQYHAVHPSGFQEFSTGALVDANSRAGRIAGDPNSTDPEGLIQQPYVQGTREQASGGFLMVSVEYDGGQAQAHFRFFDEKGTLLYQFKP
jgi:alkaline phosphatase/alkaline phosphatase D